MSNCGKTDHCCWFRGEICQYLKKSDHPDYEWACSLREKYGSWDEVHKSPEYIKDVRDKMHQIEPGGVDCGDYPMGHVCNTCGEVGK